MRKMLLLTLAAASVVSLAGIASAQEPDGQGRREGPGGRGGFMRAMPVMAALDADEDGEISAAEISNAAAALKGLDDDNNGKLTDDELRPVFGARRGRFGGPGGFPGGPEGRAGFGGTGGRAAPNAEEIVARWMTLDQNNDGRLAKDEVSERMQGLLTRADADDDGFATKVELTKLAEDESARRGGGRRGGGGPDGFDGGGLDGPRGPRGGPRGPGGFGPPDSEQFVARALEYDEDKDGKLGREELAKMAEQTGRGFGGRGVRGFGGRGERSSGRPQRPAGDD